MKMPHTTPVEKIEAAESMAFDCFKEVQQTVFQREGMLGLVQLSAALANETDFLAKASHADGMSDNQIRAGIAGHLAGEWMPRMLVLTEEMSVLDAAEKAAE